MTDTPHTPSDSSEESQANEDRRVSYRLNKVLGATLTPLSGEAEATRLFVIDISASGFRATDHKLHEVDDYEISIVFRKGDEPFACKMRVVWNKELTVSGMFQMGCEFVDLPEDQHQSLVEFINSEREKSQPASAGTDLGRPWTMIR